MVRIRLDNASAGAANRGQLVSETTGEARTGRRT